MERVVESAEPETTSSTAILTIQEFLIYVLIGRYMNDESNYETKALKKKVSKTTDVTAYVIKVMCNSHLR